MISLRRRCYIPKPKVSDAAKRRRATLGDECIRPGYAEGVKQALR